MSKADFASAERFWSGKPSLDAVEALVAKMKEREALKEVRRMSKEQEMEARA